ncbi:hypothetical protein SAMN03159496_06157 [Rhizobium sp. NFR07]|uniref:hypothetical protein n=1 Tax=Rhizobium sp. NFR07 TaxID=1566262 RepID=UPI0008E82736|nr:hypothetical protein [Rhizobium sp. NFR07]SFB63049.1 hypothetical protein SAMN03159496_06157 [Rhizobium sp. NFR07]
MKVFKTSLLFSAVLLTSAPLVNAADLVQSGNYARGGAYATTYRVEECGLLKITQYQRSEIVRICHPPFDLNPRTGPIPGSSAGVVGTTSSFSVQ